MAIPVPFSICTASLMVAGSSKVFTITCGMGGSGGISAGTINNRWLNALCVSGSSPFEAAKMDTNWTLTELKTSRALTGGGLDIDVLNPAVAGTATKSTPAPNTSVLVHKLTGIGGRRYRGRMSVPPCNIGEGDINRAGGLESAALSDQQDWWSYVYAFMVTGGCQPYLIHYPTTLPDGGDFPPAPTSISSFGVAQLVGTNGSRLR